ncbi:MAG TPA: winged helix-turn-helix transcriptional regulator [candidate division Zixibacteria bacterium]|nr:winged helix-turn-helix transcriptional regulator [candidate division Zixibacteria bacterium]
MSYSLKSFLSIFTMFSLISLMLIYPILKTNPQISSEIKSQDKNSLENIIPQNIFSNSVENETLLVHNMEVKVRQDNSIKITSQFILANNGTEPLEYFIFEINKNISSVFSYDPLSFLPFSWEVNPTLGNIINITMRYPLLQNDIYVFSISYEIEDAVYYVELPEEYYGFDFDTTHPRETNAFNLEILLPMYSKLSEQSLPAPVYPSPNKITTEDNVVKIVWNSENRDLGENDVYLVRYIILAILVTTSLPNLLPLYIVFTFLGGILLSLLVFFLIYYYKLKPVESGLVSSLLSDTEQEIIKAINIDGGVSTQRRICDKTGYSKSKVSQILSKLEEKSVLKRERWGRTNKVTITNPSFKTSSNVELQKKEQ